MECCQTHSIAVHRRVDPTRTTTLRNAFAKVMQRKFAELLVIIKKTIVTEDAFGLEPGAIRLFQMTTPGYGAFNFPTSAEKIEAFMKWLQEQVDKGLLEIRFAQQLGFSINSNWMNMYIYDSYKRGIIRARYELIKAGYDIPTIEESGGIDVVMATPFHMDRIGILYTRIFSDLKGITDAMDSLISRVLAQGMIDGDGPALIARKLMALINGRGLGDLGLTDSLGRFIPAMRRANLLARTEIIRAHHLATIQEYRNWGVEGIIVLAEWTTAGDDRVCPKCMALEGKIFTLDEIEPMIPLHPLCRCIALPSIKELEKYK